MAGLTGKSAESASPAATVVPLAEPSTTANHPNGAFIVGVIPRK